MLAPEEIVEKLQEEEIRLNTLTERLIHYLQSTPLPLTKFTPGGKSHQRFFYVDESRLRLCWVEKETDIQIQRRGRGKGKYFLLRQVDSFLLGPSAQLFNFLGNTKLGNLEQDLCFSLHYINPQGEAKVLAVVAPNPMECEAWVLGLAPLIPVTARWGKPLDIRDSPQFYDLSSDEVYFCRDWHLTPKKYLATRQWVLEGWKRTGLVLLSDVRQECSLHFLVVARFYQFLLQRGDIVLPTSVVFGA